MGALMDNDKNTFFSGYIYDGRESYHIEPAYDISSTSHRLYKDSDGLHKNLRCGAHPRGHSNKINETQQILHKNEVLHRVSTSTLLDKRSDKKIR